ncbi:hypothetical protein ACWDUX_30105 [Streptomyces sp. NPDC003444]
MNYEEFYVEGWENGGVSLFCKKCDLEVAGGGCNCCKGNIVTLEELTDAVPGHDCE